MAQKGNAPPYLMATFVQCCVVAVLRSVGDRTWRRLILGVR